MKLQLTFQHSEDGSVIDVTQTDSEGLPASYILHDLTIGRTLLISPTNIQLVSPVAIDPVWTCQIVAPLNFNAYIRSVVKRLRDKLFPLTIVTIVRLNRTTTIDFNSEGNDEN